MIEELSDDIQNGILFLILTDLKFLTICRNKINPDIFKSSIQKQICKISFDFYDKYGVIVGEKADEIILSNFPENEQTIIITYLNKLFSEVYIKCSIEKCEERDVKGMYKKARAGQIKNFTGLDDPYEAPDDPDLVVDTEKQTLDQSVQTIKNYLQEKNLL